MTSKEDSCLEELRQEYNRFQKNYDLPEFTEINKLFDIEEIDSDTEFLLRKIRRLLSDRVAGYMRFIEIIVNPSNAPMFFFKLIKKLDESDKEKLTSIYELLGNFEVEIVKLDLDYKEEKEANFIKKIYETFNKTVKPDILAVIEKLSNGENDSKKERNGSYFG